MRKSRTLYWFIQGLQILNFDKMDSTQLTLFPALVTYVDTKPLKPVKSQAVKKDNFKPDRFIKVPSLTIHPDNLILYSKVEYISGSRSSHTRHDISKSNRNNHRILSLQARRKIDKAIKYLCYLAAQKKVFSAKNKRTWRYKVGFITLTLSSEQRHSDRVITDQLLHQFLVEAQKKWHVGRYVWKAEYQRNGNIHYHILTDAFIPHAELRYAWNRIQDKLGYVSASKNIKNNQTPNSTDIHAVWRMDDIFAYVTKYMLKTNTNRHMRIKRSDYQLKKINYVALAKITNQNLDNSNIFNYSGITISHDTKYNTNVRCKTVSSGVLPFLSSLINRSRIWGCSQDLSNIKGCQSQYEPGFYEEIDKMINDTNVKRFDKDYFSVLYFKSGYISEFKYPHLFNYFQTYLNTTFRQSSPQFIFEDHY